MVQDQFSLCLIPDGTSLRVSLSRKTSDSRRGIRISGGRQPFTAPEAMMMTTDHDDWQMKISRGDIVMAVENLVDARAARDRALDSATSVHDLDLADAAVRSAEARLDQALRRRDSIVAGRA